MHKQNFAQRIERLTVNIGFQAVVLCFCALVLSPSILAMDFSCPNAGSRGAACLITSMHQAKNTGGVNTITFGRGTYRLFEAEEHDPVNGVTGLPSITTIPMMPPLPPNNLTIIGRGSGLTLIRRDDNSLDLFRIFHIARGHNLTLDGLSVENGSAQATEDAVSSGNGGGILNAGTLTLRNVVIEQNTAAEAGGGIFNESGAVTIINSILRRNFAFNNGGGILIPSGTLTIADSGQRFGGEYSRAWPGRSGRWYLYVGRRAGYYRKQYFDEECCSPQRRRDSEPNPPHNYEQHFLRE